MPACRYRVSVDPHELPHRDLRAIEALVPVPSAVAKTHAELLGVRELPECTRHVVGVVDLHLQSLSRPRR